MASPIVLTSQPGFAVDTSLAKSNDTTYYVQNTSTGAIAVSQQQEPLLVPQLAAVAVCPSGQSITLANPTGPGTYAVLLDFGATGGNKNISCVANYGIAGNEAQGAPNRWIGGAEISATTNLAGVPVDTVQIAPNGTDGTTLVLTNYTPNNLPPAVLTYVQLSANMGF